MAGAVGRINLVAASPDHHVEILVQQLGDHGGRGPCLVGRVGIRHDVDVGVDIGEHAPHHVTFALTRFEPNDGAGGARDRPRVVAGIIVEDVDLRGRQSRAEIGDGPADRHLFVVAGQHHRNSQPRRGGGRRRFSAGRPFNRRRWHLTASVACRKPACQLKPSAESPAPGDFSPMRKIPLPADSTYSAFLARFWVEGRVNRLDRVVEIGVVASIGLLFVTFYPGGMSIDSYTVLSQARGGYLGDWHPPFMAWVWGALDSDPARTYSDVGSATRTFSHCVAVHRRVCCRRQRHRPIAVRPALDVGNTDLGHRRRCVEGRLDVLSAADRRRLLPADRRWRAQDSPPARNLLPRNPSVSRCAAVSLQRRFRRRAAARVRGVGAARIASFDAQRTGGGRDSERSAQSY